MKNLSNKKIATDFLELVVSGKIDQAYAKYVNMQGKHHNVYFPEGFETLKQAMKENHEKFPNKKFLIKNVLSDGDLVVVHSNLIMKKGETELVVFHMFRFNNNKIIEMWDCGQAIPADCLNKDGAF